tara:strand:+ start:98 stop:538 length:441 start_codon:yes stop_codon:yes gene_type:complete
MVIAALSVVTASFWFLRGPSEDELARLREFDAEAVSANLDADLRLMWQTAPLRSGAGEASTLAAIMAASRVFNTVSLVGKTGTDVKALLGSSVESSRSVYRGQPFQPLTARGMVYRFDSGTLGWQFNVYCEDDDSPVSEVERHWIH